MPRLMMPIFAAAIISMRCRRLRHCRAFQQLMRHAGAALAACLFSDAGAD